MNFNRDMLRSGLTIVICLATYSLCFAQQPTHSKKEKERFYQFTGSIPQSVEGYWDVIRGLEQLLEDYPNTFLKSDISVRLLMYYQHVTDDPELLIKLIDEKRTRIHFASFFVFDLSPIVARVFGRFQSFVWWVGERVILRRSSGTGYQLSWLVSLPMRLPVVAPMMEKATDLGLRRTFTTVDQPVPTSVFASDDENMTPKQKPVTKPALKPLLV